MAVLKSDLKGAWEGPFCNTSRSFGGNLITLAVSAAIGVAEHTPGETAPQLFTRADANMYEYEFADLIATLICRNRWVLLLGKLNRVSTCGLRVV